MHYELMRFGRMSPLLCLLAFVGCGAAGSGAAPVSTPAGEAAPTSTSFAAPATTSTSVAIRLVSPPVTDSPAAAYVAQGSRLVAVDVRTRRVRTTLADFGHH